MGGSNRRFVIEVILFASYAVFCASWMAISPLATDLKAFFGVTNAEFALLSTVVTIGKVVAPVLAGFVAMRVGLKNTILIGSLFVSCALLGPLFPSFGAFLATRTLFGIGGAVLVALVPAMVMQWFPRSELALVNGINGVAANTGFALALTLTVPLSQTAIGWRGTLLLFSVISVALCVAWAVLGRDGQPAAAQAGGTTAAAKQVGYLDVWRRRETWLIALAFTGPVALYVTFSLWLPTFYVKEFHFAKAEASHYTALLLWTGIPSAVFFGMLTKRLGIRRPFLIAGGLIASTAAFGMFSSASPAILTLSAVALGIGLFIPTAALTTLIMELDGVTPRHVTLISSTMVSFCYLVNSFVPNGVGKISDMTGSFVPGFTAVTVFSAVIVVAGVLLPETGPRRREALGKTLPVVAIPQDLPSRP